MKSKQPSLFVKFLSRYGAVFALLVVAITLGATYIMTDEPKNTVPNQSPENPMETQIPSATIAPVSTPVPMEEDTESQETGIFDSRISLLMPTQGEIQRPYSMDKLIYQPTLREYSTHSGMDISCISDQVILAAADGKIKDIYTDALWGNCLSIEHDGGYVTLYAGLGSCQVEKGQAVFAGEEIARAGNSAKGEVSQGCHLHFELKKEDAFLDPQDYIAK